MKNKYRILSCLLALMMAVTVFVVPTSASGYYSSDESGNIAPPDAIDNITITTEGITIESDNASTEIDSEKVDLDSFFSDLSNILSDTSALTPVGNMTLIDDILQDESNTNVGNVDNKQNSKQFITVQTKNGNYFYIVIDRSGDTENVYFLNLVDEADLFALTDNEEPAPAPVCICESKCIAGEINTDCAVCTIIIKDCTGKETVQSEPVTEPEKPVNNNSAILIIVLLIAAGSGAAVYFLKFRKDKVKTSGTTDLDDYDFGEDEDEDEEIEYENTEDNDE